MSNDALGVVKNVGRTRLMQGDCLDVMSEIADQSIDMILADPPYG